MLPLPDAAAIFCALAAAAVGGLWLGWDRRDRLRFEGEIRQSAFHCIRCDRLYTAPFGTKLCRCPRCRHENTRLSF